MRLSTRNQLAGTVASVDTGGVLATVKVTLAGGEEVTAKVRPRHRPLAGRPARSGGSVGRLGQPGSSSLRVRPAR